MQKGDEGGGVASIGVGPIVTTPAVPAAASTPVAAAPAASTAAGVAALDAASAAAAAASGGAAGAIDVVGSASSSSMGSSSSWLMRPVFSLFLFTFYRSRSSSSAAQWYAMPIVVPCALSIWRVTPSFSSSSAPVWRCWLLLLLMPLLVLLLSVQHVGGLSRGGSTSGAVGLKIRV